ncbi:MAG: DUF2723 domain-containing protein [Candidatus Promineofilum sp.]|nr:DUF2723 domain-containing protein [Promineifilum sp.]MBP9657148.1 DUF2723 domain-containing protein [Promineifilum sp.]
MAQFHEIAQPSLSPAHEATSGDPARFHRQALASALIALGVYVLTLAPDLSWANGAYDGAELITASVTLGIPHPPGYPTYVLLGKLFSLLPMGTVAFRYNLFSAICAAAAVGLVVLTIGALQPRIRPAAAVSAALLFGFTPLVWSQAVVAEVYSLNLLMIAAFLLVWSRRGAGASSSLLLGLAITTHLTSLFWLPAFFISGRRQWSRIAVGLALGLSPLLLLPWLAAGDSAIIWGRPTNSAGWWQLVSGQLYAAYFQPAIDAERWLNLLQAVALGPAAFLAGAGLRGYPSNEDEHLHVHAAGTISRPTPILLAATSLLYIAFSLSYNTSDAAILLLPVFLILALLVAPMLQRPGAAALLLPLVLVLLTYGARDLRRQPTARTYAADILRSAPENAILLTPGDHTIFTLLYFQQVEGYRPDLSLVDGNLFAFDWYRNRLLERYPDIVMPTGDDLVALRLENKSKRPFCLVGLVSSSVPPISMTGGRFETGDGAPYVLCAEEAN